MKHGMISDELIDLCAAVQEYINEHVEKFSILDEISISMENIYVKEKQCGIPRKDNGRYKKPTV